MGDNNNEYFQGSQGHDHLHRQWYEGVLAPMCVHCNTKVLRTPQTGKFISSTSFHFCAMRMQLVHSKSYCTCGMERKLDLFVRVRDTCRYQKKFRWGNL